MSLASKIIDLKQKRANLVNQAREIIDLAERDGREPSAEERQKWDNYMVDVKKQNDDINMYEQQLAAERSLEGQPPQGEGRNLPNPKNPEGRTSPRATEEYRSNFSRYLRDGLGSLTGEELRAMQADSDLGGGYLVAPEQMVAELLKAVDDLTIIGGLARTFDLPNAVSLGVPTLDKKADDADWTSELSTGNKTELEFGKRELKPHPLAKRILVSNKLLRVSGMNIEQIINGEFARIFAQTMEKAYMTGDGSNKPLGLFTASKDGIPTTRDIATGNTATEIKFDGLKNTKYSIKQQYHAALKWIFHRDAISQLAKEKDLEGRYVWAESVRVGEPDMLLNIPVLMSEFAPNTFTSGKYAGILGDFKYYWVARALDMNIQRLLELYAESNQTGFIGRLEADGAPVLGEAFARVKLG